MFNYSNNGGCLATLPMSLLSWNCRGFGNLRRVNVLAKVVNKEEPIIIFLMETKLKNDWLDLLGKNAKLFCSS